MLNHSISPNGHQTLKKETDQPIIHFFCTYTPEEILMAADLQPHRVIPFHFDPSLANTFLDSNFCPYVRSILAWAMEIYRNQEMSPTVILNSCDGMRRLYDVWKYYINSPFTYFLDLPRKRGLLYEEQFKLQLYCLKEKLERYTGKKITDKKLHFAIQQANEFHKMIQQLDQMRQQKMISLSNYEFFRLVQDGSQYSKVVYNDYLRNYLHHCNQNRTEKRQRKNKKSFKILITGTVLDNLGIIKMIEQYSGFVEVADTCNGWRYYFNTIDENEGEMIG